MRAEAVGDAFQIPARPEAVADLNARLSATRWADAVTSDWSYGTGRPFLRELVRCWLEDYSWPNRRAALNALPHRRADVDGFGVHFLHFRGQGANPMPLLLMNGWPSSFVEYQRIAPMLARPGDFGADPADAFDVIIPALPGFGFSDKPEHPRQLEPEELFAGLMAKLGYQGYLAAGTDIGAGVATRLGLRHPDAVAGIHISAIVEPPTSDGPSATAAELAYAAEMRAWDREEGGYQAVQSTRPQTLAFALTDSPAGMASWILEKFRAWSDCGGDVASVFPMEMLIDNLMIYWLTETMASSMRRYFEAARFRAPLKATDRVLVPTAVGVWPHDLVRPPRERAERFYNVQRYTRFPRGGHFPAWEAPELYAADLRAFARSLR